MSYLVGIDSGGTKTEVLVTDLQGNVLKRTNRIKTSATSEDLGLTAFSIREDLRLSFEELEKAPIDVLVLGLAGLDTKEEVINAQKVLREVLQDWQIKNLLVFNDSVMALANGTTAANAIVLIGGTGSNCLGHNDKGQKAKSGGLNWALSDDGSGFDAGRLALRAAVKSADGRGLKSILEKEVFTALKVNSVNELKNLVYRPLINKREMAALAPIVTTSAEKGDAVARKIIDYCLNELTIHVLAVAKKLDLQDKVFDLVVAGAFALHLLPQLKEKLTHFLPKIKLVSADEAPVYGAIKIAQQFMAGQSIEKWQND